jgi:hypothetical protein
MNAVEKHPQRQQIIDGILAGESLRKLAATVAKGLHPSTLSRYRMILLGRATKTLQSQSVTSKLMKELANPGRDGENAQDRLRADLQQSVEHLEKRFEPWIQNAETVAKDGQLHHRALASHSRNLMTAVELRARLAGLLQDSATALVQIAVCGTGSRPGEMPAEHSTELVKVRR